MAIQDDFKFWHSHGEADDAGKLLLLSRKDEEANTTVSLFFDDNIEREYAHIVDARYVGSDNAFTPVPFETSRGR